MNKFLIFAASLALASPAIVQAATPADGATVSIRVSYRDLDLSNPNDAAVLMQRLRDAALRSCGGSQFSVSDYRRSVEASACYRESLRRAVAEIGSATVSQVYNTGSNAASE